MKKITLAGFFLCALITGAQVPADPAAGKRFIEVTGTAEVEIIPDEIYITITLQEANEKANIAKQEEALNQAVKDLGIDPGNLSLNSADADYGRMRAFRKEVTVTKSYLLKVGDASMLSRLYEKLDKLDAQDAFVSRINHSKIIEHTKEARIKAIKAAKDKAEYLLMAIGQQPGLPLHIMETENYISNPVYRNQGLRKFASNVLAADDQEAPEISFRKIRIRSSYLVKYEIR